MAVRRQGIALEPATAADALSGGERSVAQVWDALAAGELGAVRIGRASPSATVPPPPECLLPGSFNPIHAGHRRMLATATARLGTAGGLGLGSGSGASAGAEAEAAFELAIANPDKPALSPADTARRLAGFAGDEVVWLTRAPTFPEKARIFPGATFAVGVDTIVRIGAPRYYGGTEGLAAAISALGACRFLVFGRVVAGSGFETLDSVSLPAPLRALCDGVPEADFRADVSSTELRRTLDDGDPR